MRYNIEFEAISPIHIGSKDRLSSMDYIISDKRFYVINTDKVLDLIATNEDLLRYIRNGKIVEVVKRLGVETVASYSIQTDLDNYSSEVYSFIKYGSSVYIPGSSIKGSIRSALLYYRLKKDKSILDEHIKWLKQQRLKQQKGLRKKAARRLEDRIFRNNSSDMHNDILRYLAISDMYPTDTIENVLELSRIAILPTTLKLAMEVLKVGSKFNGHIDSDNKIGIDEIKESCKVFANDIIEYEINNIDKYGEYKSKVRDFYRRLTDINNDGRSILLRVGRQGHYSITIGILLYNKLKEENIAWLVREPINRKLCLDKEVMPLGWATLSINRR